MSRFKRFLRSSRGANAVEFALIAPIFILILMGIIDFGRIFNAYITITHAAREGARWAAVCDGCTVQDVRDRAHDRASSLNVSAVACNVSACSCVDVEMESGGAFPGVRSDYITVTVKQFVPVTVPLMNQFFGTGCVGTIYEGVHGVNLTTSSAYFRER